MKLSTRVASAVVPVLAAAGIVLSGAAPAQAATTCATPGTTTPFPGSITLANSACADQTPLSGGFVRIVGSGAFNVRVPKQTTITSCTSYVFLYVDDREVKRNGQSCTTQARAGVVSTNTLTASDVEATSSVTVRSYFAISYGGTVYTSGNAYYAVR